MLVTEAIAVEHATLIRLMEQVERVLPRVASGAEIGRMATMLEGLLEQHRELETNFGFLPLDHTLKHRKALALLHHDHQEVDARFHQVRQAATCDQARELLRAALRASRAHFREEERTILPLLERTLSPTALRELGDAFKAPSRVKRRPARALRRAR